MTNMFDAMQKRKNGTRLHASQVSKNGFGDMYEIPVNQEREIAEFLSKHKYLNPILKEAKLQIVSIFGESVKIVLELQHDPEEGWDELFIVIKSSYSPEEAIRLENKLAEEWFLDRIKATKGKLNIVEEPL